MAAINTDKETAVAVMAELVKVGVAFEYRDMTAEAPSSARWAQRIKVDDSRTELLNVIWSIVTERRQTLAHTQTTIARVARFGAGRGPAPVDVRHTTCELCGQDIEGVEPFPRGEWRDRGNNTTCPSGPSKGQKHVPYPD